MENDAPYRARFLAEALPYIRAFHGKTLVIRYDGHARTHRPIKDGFGRDLALLQLVGMSLVVVHEGDAQLNQEIVGFIGGHGGRAVGLGGGNGRDPELIGLLHSRGFIPVVMPASCGSDGGFPGAEADIAAAGVAEAVKAEKLVLMTNVPGVLHKDGTLFSVLTAAEIENLFADGTIHCGWQAKLNAALQAVRRGVKSVHVINGRVPGALLLELLTGDGLGTMIRADDVAQSLSDGRHCLAA